MINVDCTIEDEFLVYCGVTYVAMIKSLKCYLIIIYNWLYVVKRKNIGLIPIIDKILKNNET